MKADYEYLFMRLRYSLISGKILELGIVLHDLIFCIPIEEYT